MKQENLPPSTWRKIVKAILVALKIIFGKSKNDQK